jgi:hypothetical protein
LIFLQPLKIYIQCRSPIEKEIEPHVQKYGFLASFCVEHNFLVELKPNPLNFEVKFDIF